LRQSVVFPVARVGAFLETFWKREAVERVESHARFSMLRTVPDRVLAGPAARALRWRRADSAGRRGLQDFRRPDVHVAPAAR